MRLLLSSDTLPLDPLETLRHAAGRRSLDGLEITMDAGQTHGLERALDEPACACGDARDPDAAVRWIRVPLPAPPEQVARLARSAARIGAGLVLGRPESVPAGTVAALEHTSDPHHAAYAAHWARENGHGTAWHVDLETLTSERVGEVLELTRPTLVHVRLPGSGAEGEHEDNEAVGELMMRLALRGYHGTIALIPTPGGDLGLWRTWLLEKRGWGCGSAARKKQTVQLSWNPRP